MIEVINKDRPIWMLDDEEDSTRNKFCKMLVTAGIDIKRPLVFIAKQDIEVSESSNYTFECKPGIIHKGSIVTITFHNFYDLYFVCIHSALNSWMFDAKIGKRFRLSDVKFDWLLEKYLYYSASFIDDFEKNMSKKSRADNYALKAINNKPVIYKLMNAKARKRLEDLALSYIMCIGEHECSSLDNTIENYEHVILRILNEVQCSGDIYNRYFILKEDVKYEDSYIIKAGTIVIVGIDEHKLLFRSLIDNIYSFEIDKLELPKICTCELDSFRDAVSRKLTYNEEICNAILKYKKHSFNKQDVFRKSWIIECILYLIMSIIFSKFFLTLPLCGALSFAMFLVDILIACELDYLPCMFKYLRLERVYVHIRDLIFKKEKEKLARIENIAYNYLSGENPRAYLENLSKD